MTQAGKKRTCNYQIKVLSNGRVRAQAIRETERAWQERTLAAVEALGDGFSVGDLAQSLNVSYMTAVYRLRILRRDNLWSTTSTRE